MTHAQKDVNQYELWGKGLHIQYSTTSISGQPLLTYEAFGTTRHYKGDDIRVTDSELGRLVTVTVAVVPDLKTDTFSFLIPPINLFVETESARFTSVGVHATHETSIAGPGHLKGALISYDATDLKGLGRSVVS